MMGLDAYVCYRVEDPEISSWHRYPLLNDYMWDLYQLKLEYIDEDANDNDDSYYLDRMRRDASWYDFEVPLNLVDVDNLEATIKGGLWPRRENCTDERWVEELKRLNTSRDLELVTEMRKVLLDGKKIYYRAAG